MLRPLPFRVWVAFCSVLLAIPAPALAFEGSLTAAQEKQLTVFGIRASLGLAVGPQDIKKKLSRSELAEMIATGLNSNGLLCAKLVKVQPLARAGYYEASCIAYRGGSGEKLYVIEAPTGVAFEA